MQLWPKKPLIHFADSSHPCNGCSHLLQLLTALSWEVWSCEASVSSQVLGDNSSFPSPLPADVYASYFLEISISMKAKDVNELLVNYQLVVSEMLCLISIQQCLSYVCVS